MSHASGFRQARTTPAVQPAPRRSWIDGVVSRTGDHPAITASDGTVVSFAYRTLRRFGGPKIQLNVGDQVGFMLAKAPPRHGMMKASQVRLKRPISGGLPHEHAGVHQPKTITVESDDVSPESPESMQPPSSSEGFQPPSPHAYCFTDSYLQGYADPSQGFADLALAPVEGAPAGTRWAHDPYSWHSSMRFAGAGSTGGSSW
eukprot:TRINITY_DN4160_c0_g1_i1.p1 TRINITY_DN4160_c0_g1~~TRINITY_DN4160_c0_g1_i1.p1  ORF type:complete len:230 (+),score=39.89 TRINITY_DN4160_c0_g1_i1:87-692(+)